MMWYIFSFLWGSIHSVGQGWVDIFNKSLISGTLTLFWTDLLRSSGTCNAREGELWSGLHSCSTNRKNRLSILPLTQALEVQPVTLCYFAWMLQRSDGGGGGPSCWTSVDAIRRSHSSKSMSVWSTAGNLKPASTSLLLKYRRQKVIQHMTGMILKRSWIWCVWTQYLEL